MIHNRPIASREWLPRFVLACTIVASGLVLTTKAAAENWPGFRGPTGMGITTERNLPVNWGGKENENLLWKVPLPGVAAGAKPDLNQSSPIVWNDRLFMTTSFWPAGREQKEFPDHHVGCYAIADGKLLWDKTIEPGPWKLTDLRGGYTAPTPATDGERVYILFGSAVLLALDFDGKLVWRQELAEPQSFDVAISSSPIIYRDTVILLAEKNNQKSVLTAYNAAKGEVVWEQKRPNSGFNHSTPVMAEIDGRLQMLVSASNVLQGLNPADGSVLWWCNSSGDVCSPVASKGLVYTDSGRGGMGMIVEPRGEGDISKAAVKWRTGNIQEGLSSPIIADKYLYRMHNPGILKCIDLTTGEEVFAKRLEGVSISSSPIVTPEGRVFLASAGKSLVLQAGPSFELLATNELGDSGAASPAVSGGRWFLKGRELLYCIGRKP